jgi:predicted branched-subunit amino acid permease
VAQARSASWWPDIQKRQSFNAGFREVFNALIATSTWGFVTGIAMVKSGLTETMAAWMTLLVYAGSAQLTSLPLIVSSAPIWLIFAAGMVVNLRFIIFAAALQPFFRHMHWFKRLVLGFLSTDVAFVYFVARHGDRKGPATTDQLWYLLGMVIPGWISWNVFSMIGIYSGKLIPASWSLEYAAILALMAVVIPLIKTRPMAMCMLVAGVIAWLGQPLPLRLGLLAAVVGGIVAGVLAERVQHRDKARRKR